jgi:hypothetical protein
LAVAVVTPEDVLAGMDEEGRYHGGGLYLDGYQHPLPAGLTSVSGSLSLHDYQLPLPVGLTNVGGHLVLSDYPYPLPAGLTNVGGDLIMMDYPYPLPAGLTSVGGKLNLSFYAHPLPTGLTGVGGNIVLSNYEFPLPAGLTSVGGGIYLAGYGFPLPGGMTSGSAAVGADEYPFPLPEIGLPKEHYDISPPSSAAFREWFGKSHVVDGHGAPLLLYHGTAEGGFVWFDLEEADAHHPGFYFTDSIPVAGTYIGDGFHFEDPTPSLDGAHPASKKGAYRVWVRLENPFVFDAAGAQWSEMHVPEYPGLRRTYQIARAARRDGYDGCIFRNLRDSGIKRKYSEPSDVYVVFSPTQIKSALFNVGTYDRNDEDIRKNPRRKTSKRRTSKRKTSRRR